MTPPSNTDRINAYGEYSVAKVAANSLVVEPGNWLRLLNNFISLATPSDQIEGSAMTAKSYASDNETNAKEEIIYKPARWNDYYEMKVVNGTLNQTHIGKYFFMDTLQYLDVSTANGTTGQFRLEEFKPGGLV